MKHLRVLYIILLFTCLTSFKGDNLPDTFTALLKRAHLTFIPPAGMTEALIVKNGQMNYEYAIKYPDKNFEIRYTIRPLDSLMINYKNPKPTETVVSPNKLHTMAFLATMMNISQGKMQQPKDLPAESVKKEFNADWGSVSPAYVVGDFGKGYKYCSGFTIHKDDVADAYIFYLTDDPANFTALLPGVFHTLKFE